MMNFNKKILRYIYEFFCFHLFIILRKICIRLIDLLMYIKKKKWKKNNTRIVGYLNDVD